MKVYVILLLLISWDVNAGETYTYITVDCKASENKVLLKSKNINNLRKSKEEHGDYQKNIEKNRTFDVSWLIDSSGICVLNNGTKIRIKATSDEASSRGMCGGDPSNYVTLYKNEQEMFKQTVHEKCGGLYFRSAEINSEKIEVCVEQSKNYMYENTEIGKEKCFDIGAK